MRALHARAIDRLRATVRVEHVAILALALSLRGYFWTETGARVVRDATRYIGWCHDLSAGTLFGSRALVYSGYWLPYCGWLRATGEWVGGWVGLQVVLSALACVFVYEAGALLVDNRAGVVAGVAMAVQWEVYRWATRAQSEFMLTFAFALVMWRLAVYHRRRRRRSRRDRLALLASLGFLAAVRPNGLPIVFGYVLYDCFPRSSDRRLDLFFSARVNLAIAGSLAAAAAYRLSIGWARGGFLTPWKEGVIVTPDRVTYGYTPETTSTVVEFVVANAEHLLAIAALRALWFFAPVIPGWSTWHAIKAGVTLTPLMVCAGLGVYAAAKTDRRLLTLWGTPLAMMVLTAMVTWVAGWRNFLGPAAVVYALFAGYAVSTLVWPRVRHWRVWGLARQARRSGSSASESST